MSAKSQPVSKSRSKIPVGVVGVGHLGQHHAKHFHNLPDVDLVGIYDIDLPHSRKIARRYKTKMFDTLDELLPHCDALSIVTPTADHARIATQCLEAGKHVFIEKPITQTVEEADTLQSLASANGSIIQVGHIERLNPALLALNPYTVEPKYIEVQRLAPYTARGTDVPVVLDLMIHDIDIILALVNSPVKNIRASGVSIMTDSIDMANARIRFENGTVASITSSRIAKDKVRKLKLFQTNLYVTIDFLLGLTEVYKVLNAGEADPRALLSARFQRNGNEREIVYEKPPVEANDALQMELRNFLAAVRGDELPIVDGKAARDALAVAEQIHDMILEDVL